MIGILFYDVTDLLVNNVKVPENQMNKDAGEALLLGKKIQILSECAH